MVIIIVVWNRLTYITVNNISYKYVNICSEKKQNKNRQINFYKKMHYK